MITTTYIVGNSIIHRTDPRIKTIILIVIVALFFLPLSITAMTLFYIILAIATIISIGFSKLLQAMKMIFPILLFVTFLTPLFFKDGDPLLIIKNSVILTTIGISETLRLILRFSGITVCFYLFFSSTTISYFILTLQWFRLPYRAALVITIALRYIPSMIIIYNNIKDAHKLREISYDKRKIFKKLNNIFPTLVSVLINAIKSIPSLSMALELKGIGLEIKRSQFYYIKSNKTILQIIIAGATLTLFIIAAIFL